MTDIVSVPKGGVLTRGRVAQIADAQIASAGVIAAGQVAPAAIKQKVDDRISNAGLFTTGQIGAVIAPLIVQVVADQFADAGTLTAEQVSQVIATRIEERISAAGSLTAAEVGALVIPEVVRLVAETITSAGGLTAVQLTEVITQKVNEQVSRTGALTAEQVRAVLTPVVAQVVAAQLASAGALTADQVREAITSAAMQITGERIATAEALSADEVKQKLTLVVTQVFGPAATRAIGNDITSLATQEVRAAVSAKPPTMTAIAWGARTPSNTIAGDQNVRLRAFLGTPTASSFAPGFLSFADSAAVTSGPDMSTLYADFSDLATPTPIASIEDLLSPTYGSSHLSNKQCYFLAPRVNFGQTEAGPFGSPFIFLPLAQCWGGAVEGYLTIYIDVVVRPTANVVVYFEAYTGYQGSDGQGGPTDARTPGTPAPDVILDSVDTPRVTIRAAGLVDATRRQVILPFKYVRKAPFANGAIDNQYFFMAVTNRYDPELRVQLNAVFSVKGEIPMDEIATNLWDGGTPVPARLNAAPAS